MTSWQALRGSWMGHALHPLLTDTVIGTWTSGLLHGVGIGVRRPATGG